MAFGWEGDKVRLVPLDRDKHLENALRWLNDPDVTRWMEIGDWPITRGFEVRYFDAADAADAEGGPPAEQVTVALVRLAYSDTGDAEMARRLIEAALGDEAAWPALAQHTKAVYGPVLEQQVAHLQAEGGLLEDHEQHREDHEAEDDDVDAAPGQ